MLFGCSECEHSDSEMFEKILFNLQLCEVLLLSFSGYLQPYSVHFPSSPAFGHMMPVSFTRWPLDTLNVPAMAYLEFFGV